MDIGTIGFLIAISFQTGGIAKLMFDSSSIKKDGKETRAMVVKHGNRLTKIETTLSLMPCIHHNSLVICKNVDEEDKEGYNNDCGSKV